VCNTRFQYVTPPQNKQFTASWTICKQSAPRSRQITTPTPHHSTFTGRMLFLTSNQQCQSTEGTITNSTTLRISACEHLFSSSGYCEHGALLPGGIESLVCASFTHIGFCTKDNKYSNSAVFMVFLTECNKKLSYRRVTARCVLSVVILPIATQPSRNYLYDKS